VKRKEDITSEGAAREKEKLSLNLRREKDER